LKETAIFEDVFASVPFHKAEIQDLFGFEGAGPAGAGAEAVDEPGELAEWGEFENLQAAAFTDAPRRGNAGRRRRRGRRLARAATLQRSFSGSHNQTSIIATAGTEKSPERRQARNGCIGEQMIVGMGIDVAEVPRIQQVIESQKERFLRRVYTLDEVAYCEQFKNKYERYAGRFAVKEAAMKALGTGWSRGVRWVDVEVVRQRGGRPNLALKGEAKKIADAMGVKNIAVSITHTSEQAIAQVIFEG
jgi:holo-[acyl-carrier protein] synthase